jgi:replication factor A1
VSVPNRNLFWNIEEINSNRTTWNIRVKIIRLWQVSDFNRINVSFSLEMVLIDAAGDKIHATIKKTQIYKFKNDLIEGKIYCLENMGVGTNSEAYRSTRHPYKLNFQYSSLV